jgi:hypothetical protein
MTLSSRLLSQFIAWSLLFLLAGPASAQEVADTLYLGGTIITVNDEAPRAEAVAVKNGLILAVGTAS